MLGLIQNEELQNPTLPNVRRQLLEGQRLFSFFYFLPMPCTSDRPPPLFMFFYDHRSCLFSITDYSGPKNLIALLLLVP
jgi:hypothetical protein